MTSAKDSKERARPAVGRAGARFGGPAGHPAEDDLSAPDGGGGVEPEGAGGPPGPGSVGLTGARFGRAARPRRRSRSRAAVDQGAAAVVEAVHEAVHESVHEAVHEVGQGPGEPPLDPVPLDPVPLDPVPPASSPVRPYVLTRGRTRPRIELALDTLVSVAGPPVGGVRTEHEPIVALCTRPRSVAEVAALIGVPLGVAMVLVSDLAAAGSLTVHATACPAGADLALLERVLSGLHRL